MIVLVLRPSAAVMFAMQANPSGPEADAYMDARVRCNLLTALQHNFFQPLFETPVTDLETIFDMGNEQHGPLCDAPNVLRFSGLRQSMTAGDVVVDVDNETAWHCKPIGWEKIEDDALVTVLVSQALRFQASTHLHTTLAA